MGSRLPTTFCIAAVLAVSGCPFDKTPEPKVSQTRGAAVAAVPVSGTPSTDVAASASGSLRLGSTPGSR